MMSSIASRSLGAVCCLVGSALLLSTSFAPLAGTAQAADPALQPLFERLEQEGERNRVLNALELSVAALQLGDLETSEQMVDAAIARIDAVYANNESAAKARSLWYSEGAKEYKGEPYERAMAHYYRGVLDMLRGDYDNAQAAFETGLQQDAFAEEEQFSADFALLAYLRAWSFRQSGNAGAAADAFAEVQTLRPATRLPAADDNTLLIIETGSAPRKLADGVGHYELLYRRGKRISQEFVTLDDQAPLLTESIYFQASTRGGRPVESIIEGKVHFKSQTASSGEVLSDVGMVGLHASALSGNAALQNVGLGVGAIGLLSTLASANARTEADTRYWNNLPDRVHLFALQLPAGQDAAPALTVKLFNKKQELVETLDLSTAIRAQHGARQVLWLKSKSALITKIKGKR